MTAAQRNALERAAVTGKPFAMPYRHNSRQWQMVLNLRDAGFLKKDFSITAKGRKALAA